MEMEQKYEAEKMELKWKLHAKIDELHKIMVDFSSKIGANWGCSSKPHYDKPSEDKVKKVSNEIRQRNKKKKLRELKPSESTETIPPSTSPMVLEESISGKQGLDKSVDKIMIKEKLEVENDKIKVEIDKIKAENVKLKKKKKRKLLF
ncbi:hypothetical protein C1646_671038 [Rhizophagus diaphanus]|nr:hypothetical protein C1646_671038 [Rhizophagus diaphanus] [Rhizophagus sp. MUCL 43196]